MNYYPFHIGDYAAHTRNLSLLEDLAYRRLLDAYYLAERPFSGCAADVAREIGMRDHCDEVAYVLGKFFELTEAGWVNKRAEKEITHFSDKKQKASEAGKASAQRRSNARSTSVEEMATSVEVFPTDVQLTNNQEPITNIEPNGSIGAPKRKRRIPSDFLPNEAGIEFANERGVSVQSELQKFTDYHTAKGSTMLDWQAAWRTWVGNAKAFAKQAKPQILSFAQQDEMARRARWEEMTGRKWPTSETPAEIQFIETEEVRRIA
mgnify:CR=1 FL=1